MTTTRTTLVLVLVLGAAQAVWGQEEPDPGGWLLADAGRSTGTKALEPPRAKQERPPIPGADALSPPSAFENDPLQPGWRPTEPEATDLDLWGRFWAPEAEGDWKPWWLKGVQVSTAGKYMRLENRARAVDQTTNPIGLTLYLVQDITLSLQVDGYGEYRNTAAETETGLATDATVSLGYLLYRPGRSASRWLPSVKTVARLQVPIGKDEFRADGDGLIPGAGVTFGWKLPLRFTLNVSPGFRVLEDVAEHRFVQAIVGAKLSRTLDPWTDRVTIAVGLNSMLSDRDRSQTWVAATGSLAVGVTETVSLTAFGLAGLTSVAPDYIVSFGVRWRV